MYGYKKDRTRYPYATTAFTFLKTFYLTIKTTQRHHSFIPLASIN